MSIYYIIMIVLVALSACEMILVGLDKEPAFNITFRKKEYSIKTRYVVGFLVGIVLTVIAMIRSKNVGMDLVNYIPRFQSIARATSWVQLKILAKIYSFELGFVVFCKIVSLLSTSPSCFLIVTSIIIGIGFFIICKNSPMPLTTWMMIYCFGIWGNSLNIVRQFLALTILLCGIRYVKEKKPIQFLIVVLIASTIHTTAIMFVLIYFFNLVPINKVFMTCYLSLCAAIVLVGYRIAEFLISKTSFAWYLRKVDGSGEETLILLFAIFIAGYLFRDKIKSFDSMYNIWFGGIASAIIFNILALRWGIFARAMKYFMPLVMALLADIAYSLKEKKRLYYCFGFMLILFFVLYFHIIIIGKTALPDGWLIYEVIGVR